MGRLFDHIRELEIHCDDVDDLKSITRHLSKPCQLANVNLLRLKGNPDYDGDPASFADLKCLNHYFFNLQYIEVSHSMSDVPNNRDNIHFDFITESLKGIAVDSRRETPNSVKSLFQLIGNNLQSLHLSSNIITEDINGKFDKLKEICFPWNYPKEEISILLKQKMDNLQRIHFRDVGASNVNQQLFVDKIIKTVEYICLDMDAFGSSHEIEALSIFLISLQNVKKDRLKIKINNVTEFPLGFLEKITNILNRNCLDWMLIANNWDCSTLSHSLYLKIESQYRIRVESNKMNNKHSNFVISNKKCKINGYKERWIMSCQCCEQQPIFE